MICQCILSSWWCWILPLIAGVLCAILGYFLGRACKKCKKCNEEKVEHKETQGDYFNAQLAKAVFGKSIKKDDLKIVKGIGPEIAEQLNQNGIKTWKELSETSIKRCQEILNMDDERFRMHNPETWPQQAKMAYEGKWKELLKLQEELIM